MTLRTENINVKISKLNIASKDTIAKCGPLVSPTISINNVVRIMGRIPDKREIEKLVRASLKKQVTVNAQS